MKKINLKRLIKPISTLTLTAVLFVPAACTTPLPHQEMTFVDYVGPREKYSDTLDRWTQAAKAYNGIVETFQVTATVLSSEMVDQQVYLEAKQYHWDESQFKEARQKALYESQSHTTAFISFFTQKDEDNNLEKPNSVWNIYLETGHARVKPTSVKRSYENAATLANKFSYHNVWSRGYFVQFPLDTASVSGGATLVVTGPIGDAHLGFPSKK